jgi:hypothetical protein
MHDPVGPDPDDPELLILQPRPAPTQLHSPDSEEIKLPPRRRQQYSEQYIDDEEEDAAS